MTPELQDFVNIPAVMAVVGGMKDIAGMAKEKYPKISAFIKKWLLPVVPYGIGMVLGYFTNSNADEGLVFGAGSGAFASNIWRYFHSLFGKEDKKK